MRKSKFIPFVAKAVIVASILLGSFGHMPLDRAVYGILVGMSILILND